MEMWLLLMGTLAPMNMVIPTCWALMETKSEKDLTTILEAIKGAVERTRAQVLKLEGKWLPSAVLVECTNEEHNALSMFWAEVPIVLCLWHVHHTQYKNILKKIKDLVICAQVNKELGEIMGALCNDALRISFEYIIKWKDKALDFAMYYESEWHPKVEMWVRNFRLYKHANQDTNGAVERWHTTLKLHLRTEKPFKLGRKLL